MNIFTPPQQIRQQTEARARELLNISSQYRGLDGDLRRLRSRIDGSRPVNDDPDIQGTIKDLNDKAADSKSKFDTLSKEVPNLKQEVEQWTSELDQHLPPLRALVDGVSAANISHRVSQFDAEMLVRLHRIIMQHNDGHLGYLRDLSDEHRALLLADERQRPSATASSSRHSTQQRSPTPASIAVEEARKIRQLKDEAARMAGDVSRLEAELEQCKSEAASTREQLERDMERLRIENDQRAYQDKLALDEKDNEIRSLEIQAVSKADTVADLESRIIDLEQTCRRLDSQELDIVGLQSDLYNAEAANEQAVKELNEARGLQAELADSKLAAMEFESRIAELEDQQRESALREAELKSLGDSYNRAFTTVDAERVRIERKHEELQKEHSELQKSYDLMLQTWRDESRKRIRLGGEVAALTDQLELAHRHRERASADLAEMTRERDEVRQQHDLALEQRDQALEELGDTRRQRDEAYLQKDEALGQQDQAVQELECARRDKDEALKERDEARQQTDGASLQKEEAFRQRDEALQERDSALERQRSTADELAEEFDSVQALSASLADLRSQLQAAQSSGKRLEEDLQREKASSKDLTTANMKLQCDLQSEKTSAESLAAVNSRLQSELQREEIALALERETASRMREVMVWMWDAMVPAPPLQLTEWNRFALIVASAPSLAPARSPQPPASPAWLILPTPPSADPDYLEQPVPLNLDGLALALFGAIETGRAGSDWALRCLASITRLVSTDPAPPLKVNIFGTLLSHVAAQLQRRDPAAPPVTIPVAAALAWWQVSLLLDTKWPAQQLVQTAKDDIAVWLGRDPLAQGLVAALSIDGTMPGFLAHNAKDFYQKVPSGSNPVPATLLASSSWRDMVLVDTKRRLLRVIPRCGILEGFDSLRLVGLSSGGMLLTKGIEELEWLQHCGF